MRINRGFKGAFQEKYEITQKYNSNNRRTIIKKSDNNKFQIILQVNHKLRMENKQRIRNGTKEIDKHFQLVNVCSLKEVDYKTGYLHYLLENIIRHI